MIEIYRWAGRKFNISRLLADVGSGAVNPFADSLAAEFVESFARSILGLDKRKGHDQSPKMPFASVDGKYALDLDKAVLRKPLIMLHVGPNKGIINFGGDDGACFVLADGNHRIAKAFLDGHNGPLPILIFSQEQSSKYLM